MAQECRSNFEDSPSLAPFSVRIGLNRRRGYLLSKDFQGSGYLEQYTPMLLAFTRDALSRHAAPSQ